MIFRPTNEFIICRNVSLTPDYTHTMTFASESAQSSFFLSKAKYTEDSALYIGSTNTLRVKYNAERLWDCSYIMWQNHDYGSKWFYAFITEIKFLNESTSEITFELDILQTWYFDYDIKACFIDREHTNNDTVGANLVPEPVALGEYVTEKIVDTLSLNDMAIICATTYDGDKDVQGAIYSRVYQGCSFVAFEATSGAASQLNRFLAGIASKGKADAVVSIFMMPKAFLPSFTSGQPIPEYSVAVSKDVSYAITYTGLDGYYPKNLKLYTYPYRFLMATNNNGETVNYSYEHFNGTTAAFKMYGDISPDPSVVLTPTNYKVPTSEGKANNLYSLTIRDFPNCSWANLQYSNWLAQNRNRIGANLINYGIGGAVNAATGNVGGVAGQIQSLISMGADIYDKQVVPNAYRGNVSGTLRAVRQLNLFTFYPQTITAQMAATIDDFFSMFGYATHKVKTPNITGRASWNYVKTAGAIVTGNAPASVLREMQEILNRGITYWHGDYVGDYTRDNAITTG